LDISIIIVNYKTELHLERCLKSIYESNLEGISAEIIVVDNNSRKNELKNIQTLYNKVRCIFLTANYGFGYACNRGAEESNGRYLLFLNPDIIVLNDSIKELSDFAKMNEDISGISGLQINEKGELQYCFNDFPDIRWMFTEAFGIGGEKIMSTMLQKIEIKQGLPFEIDWAHGACLMIKREAFFEVSGFDEKIFLYYEDVDIQKKIKDNGMKVYCVPTAKFYHYERSSVRDKESQILYHYYMHKNKLYYVKKYFSIPKNIFIRLMFLLGYSSKIIMLPFRNKFKNNKLEKLKHYLIILGVYLNIYKLKSF